MNKLIIIAAFALCATHASAQAKAEVLTNKMIIEMNKAGLDKEIIITKIAASECKFDLSTNALITLKNQKIPNEVITAMMNKAETKQPVAASKTDSSKKKTPAAPVAAPDLDFINVPHYFDKALKICARWKEAQSLSRRR
jgi:hypothetical protein